jgi:hypothetical protein
MSTSYNFDRNTYCELSPSLDWEITERPIFDGNGQPIEGYKSIARSDDGHVINVAKGSYTPTPNEVLIETAESLSKATGFEIAGYDTFQNGGKVLAFLKNPEQSRVLDFPLDDYLLIGNSHDYSSSFFMGNTNVMLRCANQFTQSNQQFKVAHTTNSKERIAQTVKGFERYLEQNDLMYRDFQRFAQVKIDQDLIDESIKRVMDIDTTQEISTRKANMHQEITSCIHRECFDIGSNLLGLFNGFTYYTTHVRNAREKVFGNAVGAMASINARSYDFCKSVV